MSSRATHPIATLLTAWCLLSITLTLQMVEVDPAFCAGDSSLVRVGYAGGFGAKSILWSNGQTTKFVFADQGEKLTVTVSDAAGCSQTDSITASVINTATSPTDFFVARNAAILTASWNPPLPLSGKLYCSIGSITDSGEQRLGPRRLWSPIHFPLWTGMEVHRSWELRIHGGSTDQ